MKISFTLFLIIISLVVKSQNVVEEIIPLDTTFITYKVIYRETVGDYFQLKRAVFADDTTITAIEKNFSHGHQNGLTRIYYPSGKIRVKALFGNDKLQGEWTLYAEDGTIITKGIYNFGIKHGYWAYKSVKTYGRYIKGLKHRKWIKLDVNNQKHKAFYWKGKLKKGDDIFNKDYQTHADTMFVVATDSTNQNISPDSLNPINPHYILALRHVAENYYFRKATKDYFRKTKKERAKYIETFVDLNKDVFRFKVAPYIVPMDLTPFLSAEKLLKPTIDSLIKADGKNLEQEFLAQEYLPKTEFTNYSTKQNSTIVVYLSKLVDNIVQVDVVEFPTTEQNFDYIENYKRKDVLKFRILFLFNNSNEIVEVEYQNRGW